MIKFSTGMIVFLLVLLLKNNFIKLFSCLQIFIPQVEHRVFIVIVLTFCFGVLEVSNAAAQTPSGGKSSTHQDSITSISTSNLSTTPQADQRESLKEVLSRITTATGISFKVEVDISKDKAMFVDCTTDMYSSIKHLLAGYNWVGIQDKHDLKTVIITGKNSNYATSTPVVDSKANNPIASLNVNKDDNGGLDETCISCKPDERRIL